MQSGNYLAAEHLFDLKQKFIIKNGDSRTLLTTLKQISRDLSFLRNTVGACIEASLWKYHSSDKNC